MKMAKKRVGFSVCQITLNKLKFERLDLQLCCKLLREFFDKNYKKPEIVCGFMYYTSTKNARNMVYEKGPIENLWLERFRSPFEGL